MKYELNFKEIGQRVQDLRKKKGISQETFGGLIAYGKNTISKIERGELSCLTVGHLIDIANYFDVDVNYLLTGNKDIDTNIPRFFKFMSAKDRETIKKFLENLLEFY